MDHDRDQPVVCRGRRRQRCQARRPALVPNEADLATGVAGYVQALHLQSGAARARRFGNRDRRHGGDPGRRRRRHRPRRLRGGRVELPEQRRSGARARDHASDPAQRVPGSDRRAWGLAERAIVSDAPHRPQSARQASRRCSRPGTRRRGESTRGHQLRRGRAVLHHTERAGIVHFVGGVRAVAAQRSQCRTLLGVLGSRTPSSPASYCTMSIGVPSGASRRSRVATPFGTLTHPCDTACPSSPGRFVPWIPTTLLGQSVTRA